MCSPTDKRAPYVNDFQSYGKAVCWVNRGLMEASKDNETQLAGVKLSDTLRNNRMIFLMSSGLNLLKFLVL